LVAFGLRVSETGLAEPYRRHDCNAGSSKCFGGDRSQQALGLSQRLVEYQAERKPVSMATAEYIG
jgi:hypothetical protein